MHADAEETRRDGKVSLTEAQRHGEERKDIYFAEGNKDGARTIPPALRCKAASGSPWSGKNVPMKHAKDREQKRATMAIKEQQRMLTVNHPPVLMVQPPGPLGLPSPV